MVFKPCLRQARDMGQAEKRSRSWNPSQPHLDPVHEADLQLYLAVIDAAGLGVWDYDLDTNTKTYSDGWRRMRGLGPSDPLPDNDEAWMALVHPDDRDIARYFTDKINAGQVGDVAFDYRERAASGRWIWIMCRGRAIVHDDSGRAKRVVGVDTDITRLKLVEEKRAEMTRRLDIAVGISGIGVWEFDLATEQVTWDERTREIYGVPLDLDPLPRDIWEQFIHPDDRDRILEQTKAKAFIQEEYDLSYRIIRADGQLRMIKSRVTNVTDPLSGPKLIGVNWDVTDEHTRTSQLIRINQLATSRLDELEETKRELEHLSLHDPLTGLGNRRMIDRVLDRKLSHRKRKPLRMVVIQIDLDHFKAFNDSLGHVAGDSILQRTAAVIQETTGPLGLVARTGGDEFVILLDHALSLEAIRDLTHRILVEINKPCDLSGRVIHCTASIGVSVGDVHASHRTSIMEEADLAMYVAKRRGGNRVVFFESEIKRSAEKMLSDRDQVLKALRDKRVVPYFQPQFCTRSGRLIGVEVLARLLGEDQRLHLPGSFLAFADQAGVLERVDQIIISQALADLRRWEELGYQVPRISVNVSRTFLEAGGASLIMDRAKTVYAKVSIELLESALIDEEDVHLLEEIAKLRQSGILLEIDDFGSGRASILGLLRLRPDRVKLDKALIAPLGISVSQEKILRGLIDIVRLQGCEVLAEGVETARQRQLIYDLGCDAMQGFLLGHPMSSEDFAILLRRERRIGRSEPSSLMVD